MRPFLSWFILGAALCGAAAQGTSVSVDGDPVNFSSGQPLELRGRVMVPLRGVFEKMGGSVNWDGAAQMVTVAKGGTTIKLTVGDAHALKNEETVVTNEKSILRGGTVYVPLRFLAETLDANVHWDGATRAVHITTVKNVPAPSAGQKPPPPLETRN